MCIYMYIYYLSSNILIIFPTYHMTILKVGCEVGDPPFLSNHLQCREGIRGYIAVEISPFVLCSLYCLYQHLFPDIDISIYLSIYIYLSICLPSFLPFRYKNRSRVRTTSRLLVHSINFILSLLFTFSSLSACGYFIQRELG